MMKISLNMLSNVDRNTLLQSIIKIHSENNELPENELFTYTYNFHKYFKATDAVNAADFFKGICGIFMLNICSAFTRVS